MELFHVRGEEWVFQLMGCVTDRTLFHLTIQRNAMKCSIPIEDDVVDHVVKTIIAKTFLWKMIGLLDCRQREDTNSNLAFVNLEQHPITGGQ